jgi:glycosyltransferase involved in cell wall biosynthesis
MRTVVVIPAYDEAATLRDVAQRALAVCPHVVVVDDGSSDGCAATLDDLPVTLRTHAVNRGKAASLWTGFAAALALHPDVVVTLDGDGQHQPEDVPRLLAAARRHPAHIVIAARVHDRAQAPRARRVANAVADFWLSWAAGHRVVDSQSGQRAYPAALLRTLLDEARLRHDAGASYPLESELLIVAARRGYRTVAVPIDTVYRAGARRSHFRPVRDIARIVRMVAGHLLARRLHPRGLWRCLTSAPVVLGDARDAAAATSPGDAAGAIPRTGDAGSAPSPRPAVPRPGIDSRQG